MSEEKPKPSPAPEPPPGTKHASAAEPTPVPEPSLAPEPSSKQEGVAATPTSETKPAGTEATPSIGAESRPSPAAKSRVAPDDKPLAPAAKPLVSADDKPLAPAAKPLASADDKPVAPAADAKPAPIPPSPPVTYPRAAGVQLEAAPKASLKHSLGDAFGLLKGMGVTFGYIRKPSRVVTREYPENRGTLKMTDRFRGQVVMPHDGQGDHTCTACTLCEKACPNGSISILTTKNLASKRVLGAFVYRLSSCTLCNLCIEACPFDAIHMGHGFEMATFSREPLDLILNKKEGR